MPVSWRSFFRGKPLLGLAIGLQWTGLLLGALSVIASHQFFQAGVWPDSESVVVVFDAAAALTLAGLGFFAMASPAASRFLGHPLVLVVWGIGLWALVGSAFADFPMLALLGAPQTGQGPIWYFAFGAFIAAAMILRRNRGLFGILVLVTAGTALLAAALDIGNIPWVSDAVPSLTYSDNRLFTFNEFQGYYALGLMPLAGIWLARGPSRRGIALLVCGILVVLISRNRLAMSAIGLATVAILLLTVTPPGRRLKNIAVAHMRLTNRITVGVLLLTALLPTLFIRFADLHDYAYSLWSRGILARALDPSLLGLRALLTGHGWGHYQEYLARGLPSTGIRFFHTQWYDITRDEFHSHNAFVEALFAGGLPGLLLMLAMPVVAALSSQRRWRAIATGFAFAWIAIDAFWFEMPVTMAALALAAGMMAETSSRVRLPRFADRLPRLRAAQIGFCFVAAELAFLATLTLRTYDLGMQRLVDCLPASAYREGCASLTVPRDPRGAELDLSLIVETTGRQSLMQNAQSELPEGQKALFRRVYREAELRSAGGGSAMLALALADTMSAAMFIKNGAQLLPEDDDVKDRWPREIYDVLERAPLRLDILPTYFNWLLLGKYSDDMRTMLAYASGLDSRHPVVLWYDGVMLLENYDSATKQRGLAEMREALAGGVERFLPVAPKIKAALGVSTKP